VVSTYAGGWPPANSAPSAGYPLLSATGIAVDAAGNVFLSSAWNCVFKVDDAGNLIRVAGTGMAGYSGDGGPALSAQLNRPMGLALDPAGNLYIADSGNGRVRRVSPEGTITTVAEFGSPAGVAVDSAGNVFIADSGGNSIWKISRGQTAPVGGNGAAWSAPQAIAVDGEGNLYVADGGNSRIRKVSASGIVTTIAEGMLDHPGGVAVDGAGNVYVADTGNRSIRKISNGTVETVARHVGSPTAVALDSSGNLYYADSRNGLVRKITAAAGAVLPIAGSGLAPFAGDSGPASLAQFSNRHNRMAVSSGPDGSVYFTDNDNHRVRKVAPDGTVTSLASSYFSAPSGLAADAAGNLYVADAGHCRVFQVDAGAVVRPFGGTGFCARLDPYGLAIDSAGHLYAADRDNNRIREIFASGKIVTVPGTEGALSRPSAVAVDSAGNLWIADTGNHAIRKLAPGGVLSTVGEGAGWQPEGIAINAAGRVFFSDAGTNAIQEISVDGTVSTVAGAQFDDPSDLAFDSAGRLFVADRGNHAVRVLVPEGTQPVLAIASAHASDFAAGGTASFLLTLSNLALAEPTRGAVTVAEELPVGLSLQSMSGQGWTCSGFTCSRADSLAGGASYPPIAVIAAVAANPPGQVTNVATVSGGGTFGVSVRDLANIRGGGTKSSRTAKTGAAGQLQITTTITDGAVQYQPYSFQLIATGGTPPYTWSVETDTGVSLPEGMSLDPTTGIVSATQVNGQGGYQPTIQVTDSATPNPNTASAAVIFGVDSDTSFAGCQMFPPDSIYNQPISQLPVDQNPNHQILSAYLTGPIFPDFGQGFYPSPDGGIPWMRVAANQPLSNVTLAGSGQIDQAGAYLWPFPPWPDAVVEGTAYGTDGPDHHIMILQTSTNSLYGPQTGPCTLYETYQNSDVPSLYDAGSNTWFLGASTHYNLGSNEIAASVDTLDSGAQDSAGIPIVPLLLRYSDFQQGYANHPLRIVFPSPTNWYVWPATGCCAGSGPPQGLLYRLKASVNWQATCPPSAYPQAAVVLQTLQQYGAYMSDHGSTGFVGGVPDDRWDDDDLACLKRLTVADLEVVDNSALEVSDLSGQSQPYVASATLPVFAVGTAYSATIWATGGNPATRQFSVTSGTLPPSLALDPVAGTISGTPTSSANSPYIFSITATDTASEYSSAAQSFALSTTPIAFPDLRVVTYHSGNYSQGEQGITLNVNVTNSGAPPTSGTVTVENTLPAGFTATAVSGAGWNCQVATVTCTRSDALAAGGSYPLSITANIGFTPPYVVINTAKVSGGGEINTANDLSSDTLIVRQVTDLTVTSTHTGGFTQGQIGATYSLTVTDSGGGSTNGTAFSVVDTLPSALTATAISGTGWNCVLATLTCSRSDVLNAGSSEPAIIVTVNVSQTAPGSVTNLATVSGGGEPSTANNQASDPTTIMIGVCDVNHAGSYTVSDVQTLINETLGVANPVNDLNQDGVVGIVDVQLVINAALGLGCAVSN
jgi:sugar lactone lactonase YvrE